ncbi:MAG: ABC transporter ATP-binding protein/permease [Oscillospiraceae bacterium]|jgi:ATP-binding cassette subfamily B protein|nr:ABC transporter ATP-binding protein/permease [Oscillospiraceae bacterium]
MKDILKKPKYGAADLITLLWKASPLYAAIANIYPLLAALLPTVSLLATAAFIDAALAVVAGTRPPVAVAAPVAVLLAVTLHDYALRILLNLVSTKRAIFLHRTLRPALLKRVAELDYSHIEDQDTADLLSRVVPAFDTRVVECNQSVMSLASSAVSAAGIIVTITLSVWWAGLIIVAAAVPLMFIAKKAGENSYAARRETSKITRRAAYLSQVITDREAVEERTVFGYADALNERYYERSHAARKIQQRVTFMNFIKQKAGGVFGSVIAVGVMGSMLPPALDGSLDYGMFIALSGGILTLISQLSWGINSQVEEIAKQKEYLNDLTKFVGLSVSEDATALPKRGTELDKIDFEKIEFDNVSFSYPGTEKLVLDGASFTIERGRHYAFVGVNGAGKTTVTKLLTGLYTNYTGEIRVDGRELRDFSQSELKGLSACVFQDFARIGFSLYDNIAVGAYDADEAAVLAAAETAGLGETIAKLPGGIHTKLLKIYEGGADLSGGEWQRVAIARSLVNPAPLRILDEPTAALDPLSESRVYERFEEISKGRTTLFISHRLGSTKLADTIFVLSDGKITEQGGHAELMRQNGLYAEMFSSQAEWYTESQIL